ncbi:hypothetical protein GCM10025857_20900 [Alicyclobacillus contaminans]|nr:hypothetical protein GCM10025857_20900 [Alicyclobacillus contaminans]
MRFARRISGERRCTVIFHKKYVLKSRIQVALSRSAWYITHCRSGDGAANGENTTPTLDKYMSCVVRCSSCFEWFLEN